MGLRREELTDVRYDKNEVVSALSDAPHSQDPSVVEAILTQSQKEIAGRLHDEYLSKQANDLSGETTNTSGPVSYTHLTLPTNREV